MDYTLSTFLPECSLSQEPKTRQEIEQKVGLNACSTSMPLLMHLINNVKNNAGGAAPAQKNNFVEPKEEEKKEERPATDNLLWENKNMDIKQQLDDNSNKNKSASAKSPNEEGSALSSLNDLPSLNNKRGGLEPLDFNPRESPKQEKLGDSVDKEKKNLDEVDKKLKEFENDELRMEMDRASPDKKAEKFGQKDAKPKVSDGLEDYENDEFEDIEEDLPVEDYDAADPKDKNPEFGESGMSGSQSMGMDPSVQSLDKEDYDHIEQAVINSPFK